MIELLISQITASFQNQLIAGGLGLMVIGTVGALCRKVPHKLWNLFLYHFTVVVDVLSVDESHTWILNWLNHHSYGKRNRRLSVVNVWMKNGDRKTLLVPAKGTHWFFHKGRLIWLWRGKSDEGSPSGSGTSELAAALNPKESISIRVLGRNKAFVNDLIESCRLEFMESTRDMQLISRFKWSEWESAKPRPKRPLDSVFMPEEGKDLLADMQRFISQKDWYYKMGIPYRRGYFFHGPPGTGKSSAAEALAGALNIPIYIFNLAGLADSSAQQAIANLDHSNTIMLLIEDIDTTNLNRESVGELNGQKMSLGTLLNVLDGVQAADNVILVMTSNNPENIDPALLRKGRVDKMVEFGYASTEQILEAAKRFLGTPSQSQLHEIASWPRPISMADVQENLKQMAFASHEPENLERKSA